jgi:virulence-associated protein VapD
MDLLKRLEEFYFNVETLEMVQSMLNNHDDVMAEMEPLGFTAGIVYLTSNQTLYKSVLLRLRLCFQRGMSESDVRQSFERLNNSNVNELLNYFYGNTQQVAPVKTTPVEPETVQQDLPVEEQLESESETEDNYFDTFFDDCVQQTDDSTDIVKSADFYSAFTEWWTTNNQEDEVPDKKELKTYLKERLGKDKKGTWTNVSLV